MRGVLAAVIAALAIAAAPASAAGPRQTGTFKFTSTLPGTPTGNSLYVEFQNPDDPNLRPYAAAQMVVHIPPGTVTDTTVPPQCHATDPEIYALGFDACPADTRIGDGYAITDQGNNTTSTTELRHFNNQDEVVGVGQNEDVFLIRTIDRTKLEPSKSTSNFPAFPGVPPPDAFTPVKTLKIDFDPYVRDGRAYTTTPPTCPKAGYWTFLVDFTYRDGVTETIESRSPCQRKAR
jgi:hypothetical protein